MPRRFLPVQLLNAALVLPAAVSLYVGLRNAMRPNRGQDLQWSGAHLTLLHIDPYRQYLLHDPNHVFLFTQTPNYLHELYILLLPLAMLSFPHAKLLWAIGNCGFIALILLLLRRIYALDGRRTLLLTLLLFASTPFRIVLGAGQHTFLALLCFCLVLYPAGLAGKPLQRGLALGLSYFKYSFSPVLVFYLLLQRRWSILLVALLPPLLGVLGMWAWVHGNLFQLAVEPFLVSRTGVWPGAGDLMTLLHLALDAHLSAGAVGALTYAAALLGAAVVAAFLAIRRTQLAPAALLAAIGTSSLLLFTHLSYDYVFLLPLLALCLQGALTRAKIAILAAIAFPWYIAKVLPHAFTATRGAIETATFLLLLLMLALTMQTAAELSPKTSP